MGLPVNSSRSRASAVAATLLLHLAVAAWLLSARFPAQQVLEEIEPAWLTLPERPRTPPPPVESEAPPLRIAPISAPPLPMPELEPAMPAAPDWSGTARDVAKGIGVGPSRRGFGGPIGEEAEARGIKPAPFWKKPL